ncbi:MarP family serine protease [Saxibacter everestensis]|uniref:MarP family serine protease n=1 Tax=Saxibacter everestensis TaxID=2909229 RepID=A0ABY8QSC3_9MICO|nr:MarP family serine protease [Brevibacteriaceae bacterium ZFBP1038]
MSFVDIVLLIVAVLVAIGGWRRGALVGVLSLIGFIAGIWLASAALPASTAWLQDHDMLSSQWKPLFGLVVVLIAGFVVQTLGYMLGVRIRASLGDGVVRGLDSVGGVLASLLAACLVVWLAAGFIRTTPYVAPNSWVASSRAVAGLDRAIPLPSAQVLGQVGEVLEASGFPSVFSGQPEQIRSIDAPDAGAVEGVRGAEDSIVKIYGESQRCGAATEGSGWVMSDRRVVTNAHVVAGAEKMIVQVGGVGEAYRADVVAFDAARDVAVLKVDELPAEPLTVGTELDTGDSAVVAGFPNDGPYTLSPSRVRETIMARGLDIYNKETVVREIYSLRGIVRPGNSGGPMLDASGDVVGLVFAKSAADDSTGYALTMDEIAPVLNEGKGSEEVSTGACSVA